MNNDVLAYEELSRFLRHFYDWRHRVLVQHFTAQAALSAVAVWCFQTDNPDITAAAPIAFALATLTSLVFLIMEFRNSDVIRDCVESGQQLETELGITKGFFSTKSISSPRTLKSYTMQLRVLLVVTAVLDVAAGAMFYAAQ
ncbi:MAG: hypothetical protein OXQ92_15470, partial [Boseongicola sp.]|nr:hypothetical protein [Boseongicola sp.]